MQSGWFMIFLKIRDLFNTKSTTQLVHEAENSPDATVNTNAGGSLMLRDTVSQSQ
jgi:hypothetical protein